VGRNRILVVIIEISTFKPYELQLYYCIKTHLTTALITHKINFFFVLM